MLKFWETEGATFETLPGQASMAFIVCGAAQNQLYASLVKDNKKHDYGSPHVYTATEIFRGFVKRHSNEIGGQNATTPEQLAKPRRRTRGNAPRESGWSVFRKSTTRSPGD